MLRSLLAGLFIAATAAAAHAQEQDPAIVDFMLRPTEDASMAEDPDAIWEWENEPAPPTIEREVGPPLAGPDADEPIGLPLAGPVPLTAEQRIRTRPTPAEDDPFAATGIELGPFVIRPAIEVGGVATDNAAGSEDKVAAVGVIVAPEVNVRSEGERHDFDANFRAESIFYDREEFNTETVDARARGRYDIFSQTSLEGEVGYARFVEDFSDPDTPGGAAERPGVDAFDAALGVEQRFGRSAARLTAFANRSLHEDVPLTGGGVASREELDSTEYGGRLRGRVFDGASLQPFAEVAVAHRDFDNEEDDSGFARSSIWGELRGGLIIDRGEKLSGEFSLGYRREDIDDDRLEDLNVFLADAAILWSPVRLTEVRFDLATFTSPTSVPDVSGTITYSGLLTVARRLTPRVRAETGIGLDYEFPVGDDWRDLTFTGFAEASYSFNRFASIEARYLYERTESNIAGGDSDAHEVGIRVRIQR